MSNPRLFRPFPLLFAVVCPVLVFLATAQATGVTLESIVAATRPVVYGVAGAALLATGASILLAALAGRGSVPVALLLPLGLAPLAIGLWGYLRSVSSTIEALPNLEFWDRSRLLAAGQAEALYHWLIGSALGAGVWLAAAVALASMRLADVSRRRQLRAAAALSLGLAGLALLGAVGVSANSALHDGYRLAESGRVYREAVMELGAARASGLESASPFILGALGLMAIAAIAFAGRSPPRSASAGLAVGALVAVAALEGLSARGWEETAKVSQGLRALQPEAKLMLLGEEPFRGAPRIELTAGGLKSRGTPLDEDSLQQALSARGEPLALALSSDADTAALTQALERLPLETGLRLRLVGQQPGPRFERARVPAWALALYEAPMPQRTSVEVGVARQAEPLAQIDGDALVLDGKRFPLGWGEDGYAEPAAPVGLVLDSSIPLSSVLKAASILRAQGRTLVLLPPQMAQPVP